MIERLPPLSIIEGFFYGPRLLLDLGTDSGPAQTFTAMQVYDRRTGTLGPRMAAQLRRACPGGSFGTMSSNGQRAAVVDDCGDLGVYNAATGRLLRESRLSDIPNDIDLSPDGRLIVEFYQDGQGDLRDTNTLRVHTSLIGHVGIAGPIGFARGGEWVVSVGADRTVRVWRTSDGSLLRTLPTPTAIDAGRVLSNDRVGVVQASSTLRFYDLCDACDNASELLRLSRPETSLPLTPIGRAVVAGR